MLFAVWLTFNFHISAQSGFYIDFVFKKFAEIFVRNVYIYMAQFFGEKFMIELWTKKIFFYSTQYFDNYINLTKLNSFWFFFHLLIISIYLVCICFLCLLFFL